MACFARMAFAFKGPTPGWRWSSEGGALLARIGATRAEKGDGEADVGPILQRGVPGLALDVDDSKYFWYHHSWGDMMTVIDRADLAKCVATMAVIAYVIADLDHPIPR